LNHICFIKSFSPLFIFLLLHFIYLAIHFFYTFGPQCGLINIVLIQVKSCDTEDWSNDDKFSFDHGNKLHFTRYSHRKQLIYITIIFHYFYSILY